MWEFIKSLPLIYFRFRRCLLSRRGSLVQPFHQLAVFLAQTAFLVEFALADHQPAVIGRSYIQYKIDESFPRMYSIFITPGSLFKVKVITISASPWATASGITSVCRMDIRPSK